jgi:hypothetical protein
VIILVLAKSLREFQMWRPNTSHTNEEYDSYQWVSAPYQLTTLTLDIPHKWVVLPGFWERTDWEDFYRQARAVGMPAQSPPQDAYQTKDPQNEG